MSLRVQLFAAVPGHVQPVPAMDTKVRPAGAVSVRVTVPLVGPAPLALETVTEYVAFSCPCVKLPLCIFVIVSTGGFVAVIVESVLLAVADPPPDTETELTSGDIAFAAIFTVTVMGG